MFVVDEKNDFINEEDFFKRSYAEESKIRKLTGDVVTINKLKVKN